MVTRNDFAVIAIQNVWGEGVGVGGGSEEKGEVCKTGDGKDRRVCVHVCMCTCVSIWVGVCLCSEGKYIHVGLPVILY